MAPRLLTGESTMKRHALIAALLLALAARASSVSAAVEAAPPAEGSTGEIWCYKPIPIFAVGCTVGVMNLAPR